MKCILVIALTTVIAGSASAADDCFNLTSKERNLPQNCYMPPLVLKSYVTVDESDCGGYFLSEKFGKEPSVQWSRAGKNAVYTFIVSKDGFFDKFLWAVSNIPGAAFLGNGSITGYTQLMKYNPPPLTKQFTFYHAYIFLQTKKVTKESLPLDPMEFVKEQELCGPKAATSWITS